MHSYTRSSLYNVVNLLCKQSDGTYCQVLELLNTNVPRGQLASLIFAHCILSLRQTNRNSRLALSGICLQQIANAPVPGGLCGPQEPLEHMLPQLPHDPAFHEY